ncbi:MAG: tyrosine recombinase [Bacilli bacterium]
MLESNLLIINDYIDYLKYERKLSINTTSSYYNNLYLFSKYLNNKDILVINAKDIRDFIYSIDKSSKTKAHYLSVLNSFYNYLINTDKIKVNPCNTVKMPKMEQTLPNYLTTEEIDKLFNIRLIKPLDYRNKAMLELLYATGTRISELINLTFSQVDFADCTLRVMGKGKKERLIPISDNALEYLLLYINEYRPFILKTKTSEYIFINRDGHMISRQGFFKILKDLCKKAGIKKNISPHTLRHSFATHLLNNGADLRVIQELLGHENLTTTEIYSHLQNKKIVDDYTNHPRAMIEKGIK